MNDLSTPLHATSHEASLRGNLGLGGLGEGGGWEKFQRQGMNCTAPTLHVYCLLVFQGDWYYTGVSSH